MHLLVRLTLPIALCAAMVFPASADTIPLVLKKGHSKVMDIGFDVDTVAVGNENIADALVLSTRQVLLNGQQAGSTSLSIIGKDDDSILNYHIQIVHDLSLLHSYLNSLDKSIVLTADPNSDAVILTGVVPNEQVIQRAVEATVRFLGNSQIALGGGNNSGGGNSSGGNRQQTLISPNLERDNTGLAYSEIITSGTTRVVNLLTTSFSLKSARDQLQELLQEVDPNISVNFVNGVFVLRGTVETSSKLTQALVMADRFVSDDVDVQFQVISDRGGVLAGSIDDQDEPDPLTNDLQLRGFTSRDLPIKGNLAQNVSRGDIVSVANGRIISMLKIADQPRIEIRMQIVSVDRNKTDELGIDWRIDHIGGLGFTTLGSESGNTAAELEGLASAFSNNSNDVIENGNANLFGLFIGEDLDIGIDVFIRALTQRGIAKILSEPVLTAVSGESASFLVGGEIPLLSGNTSTTVNGSAGGSTTTNVNTTVYREFGIILNVVPTVLDNGKISVVLDQQLTEPDFGSNAIQLNGVNVPAFNKRSVQTITEARSGETWAVAGLLSSEDSKRLNGVPWLSRIPVIGAFFSTNETVDTRNELILVVTASRLDDGHYSEPENLFKSHPSHSRLRTPALPPESGNTQDETAATVRQQTVTPKKKWYDFLLPDENTGMSSSSTPREQNNGSYRPFGR